MEHVIIRESSSEMRAIARNALRGNWKSFAIVMALYYVLTTTLPAVMDYIIPGATITRVDEVTGETLYFSIISTLYFLLLTGPFSVGLGSFTLYFFRRKELQAGHLFDGFECFLKALSLMFLMTFYIFLWSLLLFIPGIIAGLRYSQAFYILADHPEYSARECINLSKQYMAGNKAKLFCFSLTFIGWGILVSVAAAPLALLPLTGIPYILGDFIFSIPYFFFFSYGSVGSIVFYELLSGNLMAKPRLDEQNFHNMTQNEIHQNEFDQ